MGVKKSSGADGLNFELNLTVVGLENLNLPEETLKNENGKDIVRIWCCGNRLSAYINLPHSVRPNNTQPFGLYDCIKIEIVKNQVVEYMREYLKKHIGDKHTDVSDILSKMSVAKMECNVTVPCVGKCQPKDVINLFDMAFAKTTVYKETTDKARPHKKSERGMTTTKQHEYVLKIYDKTFEQRQSGNLTVESNLIRVEIIFLDRSLHRMYGCKRSLEDILTKEAIQRLITEYQTTFNEICENNIKPLLNNCTKEIFISLTKSKSKREISETVARCRNYIVDIEVLRKALKHWYATKGVTDNSKRMIAYYKDPLNDFNLPSDVLRTIKLTHKSA